MISRLYTRKKTTTITAVHTHVPGRVRFYVPGLKYRNEFKLALEALAQTREDIFLCRASTITGKVL